MDTQRKFNNLAAQVDEALMIYEAGNISEAMKILSSLGFKASDVHRILLEPSHRRQYINDMIVGY